MNIPQFVKDIRTKHATAILKTDGKIVFDIPRHKSPSHCLMGTKLRKLIFFFVCTAKYIECNLATYTQRIVWFVI